MAARFATSPPQPAQGVPYDEKTIRPSADHIDLTLDDDDDYDMDRASKRMRFEVHSSASSTGTLSSSSSHSSISTLSPNPAHMYNGSQEPGRMCQTYHQPQFHGPSQSTAFFPLRNVVNSANTHPASSSNLPRQVIDLTSSPSPPTSSSSLHPSQQDYKQSSAMPPIHPDSEMSPKTPVCIGQLTVTALVLYPISYLSHNPTANGPSYSDWAPVRLQYDAAAKSRSREETIQIRTPHAKLATGSLLGGEQFGVVEQRVATVLGPMMMKGLIRLDAKVKRGIPNLPILPLQMLVHTPKGNIPTVSQYLQQNGLLLDHPSPIFDPNRLANMIYINPHSPPPGGHARNLITPGRWGYSGPGGSRWNTPSVSAKSVEVQRSQLDEAVFLKDAGELEETEPTADVATTLYPHQKKALTFLLEREQEKLNSSRPPPSLWQQQVNISNQRSWFNVVTRQEVTEEPEPCKGSLLADDMGLGKTITCVSLIAATLSSARTFAASPIPSPRGSSGEIKSDPCPLLATHFSGAVWGMPDVSTSNKSAAAVGKIQEKCEAQRLRHRRIKLASRATLIICPLSTVVNWEEQFREHWAGKVSVVGGASGPSCNPVAQGTSTIRYTDTGSLLRGPQPDLANAFPPGSGRSRSHNSLRIYVYHGNARRPEPNFLADFDAVITTYATLASEYSKQNRISASGEDDDGEDCEDPDGGFQDGVTHGGKQMLKKSGKRKKGGFSNTSVEITSPLQSIYWFRVVLDEAHSIKETSTIASRACCDLLADRRVCLTGTPVQNKLDDLFALIKFLRFAPFDERSVWQEYVGQPVKANHPEATERLQKIMKCITLRRTKETTNKSGDKILALPPRRDELRMLKFDEQEQAIYSQFYTESKAEFNELSERNEVMKNYVGILQKILRLRQICDHFELVEGKTGSACTASFDEVVAAISQHGINPSRANAIFSVLRESGTTQCVECGCELNPASEGGMEGLVEVDGFANAKKSKKTKAASSRNSTRSSSPVAPTPVLSRCQHLFCLECYRNSVCPGWPKVPNDTVRSCTACQTALAPSDAAEFQPDCSAEKKKPAKKEKRQRGLPLDNFRPSTKIKALIGDLLVFSRANPYTANYDPSSLELEMVDSKGNQVDDSVVKTVVFSQWTTMLDKVEDALEVAGIKFDRLDGTMKRDDRTRAINTFKHDSACEVLLVSLKAGGVGLNLTAAQRVYLMDPYWNPAVENQAVDRIHRLGQTRPVTTIKLIIENTIEARLLEVQQRKTELAKMTLDQNHSRAEVQRQRVEELGRLFG